MTHSKILRHSESVAAAIVATFFATAAASSNNAPAAQTTAPSVTFAQFVDDNGASARVDQAGKLRMLSQRVTATACYVRAGVDTASTLPALIGATDEFEAILNALQNGDPERGIFGAEERRRTQVGLQKLHDDYWVAFAEQARLISAGAGDATNVAAMATQSQPLLEFAMRMVSEISGQYSDPTILLQADAMVIDIAGRQRMLSQRISKNACLLGTGLGTEATMAELAATVSVFDTSLHALYHGMTDAGVKPPPTEEIADALGKVVERWNALQPVLASVSWDGSVDSDVMAMVYTETTALTGEMNTIVGLYAEASKLGI